MRILFIFPTSTVVPSYKWLLCTRNVVSANEKLNLYILFNFYLNLNNHTWLVATILLQFWNL